MTFRRRLPYIVILGITAFTEAATGTVRLWGGEAWWTAAPPLALSLPLTLAAIALGVARPPLTIPVWSRIFEILRTGRGAVIRCIECDEIVIASASGVPLLMTRVLTYMHAHYGSDTCRDRQRERAETLRLASPAAGEATP